ncbi:MAG: hypothetical protein GY790_21225, partial [Bacteroidetes bacterium]|nr:hypothetical protein [Bacteroidota bacterium]
FHAMWECSEHGVPRLINKICKLSLKAGETNELTEINGEIIRQIGDRFKKITRPAGSERRHRKQYEDEIAHESVKEFQDSSGTEPEDQGQTSVEPVTEKEASPEPVLRLQDDGDKTLLNEAEESGDKEISECTTGMTKEEFAIHDGAEQKVGMFPEGASFADEQTHSEDTAAADVDEEEEGPDEVDIGGRRFQLDISQRLIEEARSSGQDQCNKLAGTIAAHALRSNSELTKVA